MKILGIESSCDETGVALYDSSTGAMTHALNSQIALHEAYGGVVPELASRDHVRHLVPLIETVLARAHCTPADLQAIAVTAGPGLAGALLVGSGVASAMAYALDIPLIPVHHLEGHLLSPMLADSAPRFPYVCLLVSGGHTQLIRVLRAGQYQRLGDTLDDAAGEAFDKTAQMLGLGYPGGPAVSRLAGLGRPGGRDGRLRLPRPLLERDSLDMSFSGLKTAVLNAVERLAPLSDQDKADVARAFVESVVDVLTEKCRRALQQTGLRDLVVAGGVGANTQLRSALNRMVPAMGGKVYYPPLEWCTDNGAMIAYAGLVRLQDPDFALNTRAVRGIAVRPRWDLCDSWSATPAA
jgi:N6-L-threonylcarbamoyladenine synthase